jgi:hypothetical protein
MKKHNRPTSKPSKTKKRSSKHHAAEDKSPAIYQQQSAGKKGGRRPGSHGGFHSQPKSIEKKYWRS